MKVREPCLCDAPEPAVQDAANGLEALRDHLVGALAALDGLLGSSRSGLAGMPPQSVHADVQAAQLDALQGRPSATLGPLLLTASHVAARLGMSTRSLRRLRQDPRFPKPRVKGRVPRWRASDIEAWVEGRR